MKYDGNEDGGENTCDNCHFKETWEEKGMENLRSYQFGHPPGYKNAWKPANPGNYNDDVASDENSDSSGYFEGGFAGKCPEGESWNFDAVGGWECSGSVENWDQTVIIPDLNKNSDSKETIGIVIMPYNVQRTAGSSFESEMSALEDNTALDFGGMRTYRFAKFRVDPDISSASEAPELTEITAECYPYGDKGTTNSFTRSVSVDADQGTPKPIAIWGKVEMGDKSTYKCEWWYSTESSAEIDTVENEGVPVDLAAASNLPDLNEIGSENKRNALLRFFKDRYSGIEKKYKSRAFKEQANSWESEAGGFYEKNW
jgi:hypothetical protein